MIECFVHTPKALASKTDSPAYIYAHGGGGVVGNAEAHIDVMCLVAVNLNCVVFCPEYRKGPETKCPVNH